jgi:hypothetical protein
MPQVVETTQMALIDAAERGEVFVPKRSPIGTQLLVRLVGVEGWDGTSGGVGKFENEETIGAIFEKFGPVRDVQVSDSAPVSPLIYLSCGATLGTLSGPHPIDWLAGCTMALTVGGENAAATAQGQWRDAACGEYELGDRDDGGACGGGARSGSPASKLSSSQHCAVPWRGTPHSGRMLLQVMSGRTQLKLERFSKKMADASVGAMASITADDKAVTCESYERMHSEPDLSVIFPVRFTLCL